MPNKITLLESEQISGSYLVFTENVDLAESTGSFEIQETEIAEVDIQEGEGGAAKKALKVRIKAIHAGRTGNHHIFKTEKLQGSEETHTGVHSFTYPYNKPMLTHHNTTGEPVGRIIFSEYSDEEGGVIIIEVIVSDPDAMEKVKDGRYNTVSIGCRTNSAKCNICGTDRMEEWCSHRRGVEYEGVICGWELGDLFFHECSFVNVPADTRAQTLSWEEVEYDKYSESQTDNQGQVAESAEGSLTVTSSQEEGEGDPQTDPTIPDNEANTGTNDEGQGASEESVGNEEGWSVTASVSEATFLAAAAGNSCSTSNTTTLYEPTFQTLPYIAQGSTYLNYTQTAWEDVIKEAVGATVKTEIEAAVTAALEPVMAHLKESDNLKKVIAQNNASLEKSSVMTEKALTAMKDIYCRLQGYLEGENTDNFDFAWSVEQLKENIDKLFARIEDVSAMQEQYKAQQLTKSGKIIEEKPNSHKSVSEKQADMMHSFLTARRF